MTPLRQRMLEDMQLRGFAPRTQEAYVRAVHQLAAHFRRPPDQLGEADLRQYFLYLTNVKHFAAPVSPAPCAASSSSTSAPCAANGSSSNSCGRCARGSCRSS